MWQVNRHSGKTLRRRRIYVAIAASVVAIGVAACSSGGSSASGGGSSSNDSAAFYKGKTIRWIIPEAPGTSFYEEAQVVGPVVASYLHAKITLTSVATGNGSVGEDQFAASKPDGLTIGSMIASTDVSNKLTNTPGINFSILDPEPIGGQPSAVLVVAACVGSPFTSWNQLVSSGQTVDYLSTVGGATEQRGQLLLGGYQIPAKMVTGYESSKLVNAGCLRGDGKNSIIFQSESTYTPLEFTSGKLHPLLITGSVPSNSDFYSALKDLPTLQGYLSSNPPKTALGKSALDFLLAVHSTTTGLSMYFGAPKGTPAGLVNALRKAFAHAYAQSSVTQQLTKDGEAPVLLGASQAKAVIQKEFQLGPGLVQLFKYGT